MDVNERLRRLEDRAAINDLVVSYFLAADGDDLDGVGASFTEDATFSTSGEVVAHGRQAIVGFITAARDHMGLTVHTPHYAQIQFQSDDAASGLVGAHLEMVLAGTAIYGAVRYVDQYVRHGAGWRIATRDMRTIYVAPWGDVGAALVSEMPVRWPGAEAGRSDYSRA